MSNNEEPAPQHSPDQMIQFVSNDGVEAQISRKAMDQSNMLQNIVAMADENVVIPLQVVAGRELTRIAWWCERMKGKAPPTDLEKNPKCIVVPDWVKEWLPTDDQELFALICAANYLEIYWLLNYACRMVTDMAKGLKAAEMRVRFGINTNEEDAAAGRAPQ